MPPGSPARTVSQAQTSGRGLGSWQSQDAFPGWRGERSSQGSHFLSLPGLGSSIQFMSHLGADGGFIPTWEDTKNLAIKTDLGLSVATAEG